MIGPVPAQDQSGDHKRKNRENELRAQKDEGSTRIIDVENPYHVSSTSPAPSAVRRFVAWRIAALVVYRSWDNPCGLLLGLPNTESRGAEMLTHPVCQSLAPICSISPNRENHSKARNSLHSGALCELQEIGVETYSTGNGKFSSQNTQRLAASRNLASRGPRTRLADRIWKKAVQ